ncbi:MAG TPA: hypothetical protein ENH91_03325 [Leeuwenhoekiella sp.]|nr:hypothetical protein [Leeuwenhoekiella sp.]
MAVNKKESLFLVSFEGLNLSKEHEKRIEQGIRDLVMKEIATLDNDKDVAISKRFTNNPTWKDLWDRGQLAGFWIKGYPEFPSGGPHRPS